MPRDNFWKLPGRFSGGEGQFFRIGDGRGVLGSQK